MVIGQVDHVDLLEMCHVYEDFFKCGDILEVPKDLGVYIWNVEWV